MQVLANLVSLVLVLYGVRAATLLPAEGRNSVHRELSEERRELMLKLVSELLDGGDNNILSGEIDAPVSLNVEEPLNLRLEERSVSNRFSQLPQRDHKAPCKNFFWKTFTSC